MSDPKGVYLSYPDWEMVRNLIRQGGGQGNYSLDFNGEVGPPALSWFNLVDDLTYVDDGDEVHYVYKAIWTWWDAATDAWTDDDAAYSQKYVKVRHVDNEPLKLGRWFCVFGGTDGQPNYSQHTGDSSNQDFFFDGDNEVADWWFAIAPPTKCVVVVTNTACADGMFTQTKELIRVVDCECPAYWCLTDSEDVKTCIGPMIQKLANQAATDAGGSVTGPFADATECGVACV